MPTANVTINTEDAEYEGDVEYTFEQDASAVTLVFKVEDLLELGAEVVDWTSAVITITNGTES